jgi:hypothetical protein
MYFVRYFLRLWLLYTETFLIAAQQGAEVNEAEEGWMRNVNQTAAYISESQDDIFNSFDNGSSTIDGVYFFLG